MNKFICSIVILVFLSPITGAIAIGIWDKGVMILGLNPNGDYQSGNQINIKITATSDSGCQVIGFKPGFGNIPNDSSGVAAINRIYSTYVNK